MKKLGKFGYALRELVRNGGKQFVFDTVETQREELLNRYAESPGSGW